MYYASSRHEITLKAFQGECLNDKKLQRLKAMRLLILALLIGAVFKTSIFFIVLGLLFVWFVSSRISQKRKNIKNQFLGLHKKVKF